MSEPKGAPALSKLTDDELEQEFRETFLRLADDDKDLIIKLLERMTGPEVSDERGT